MRKNIPFKFNSNYIYKICVTFLLSILIIIFTILLPLVRSIAFTILTIAIFFIQTMFSLLLNSLYSNTDNNRKFLEKDFISGYNIHENYLRNDLFLNDTVFPANHPLFANLEILMFYYSVTKSNKYDIEAEEYIKFKNKYESIIPYTMSYFDYYFFLKTKKIDYYNNATSRLIPYEDRYKALLEYNEILMKKLIKFIKYKPAKIDILDYNLFKTAQLWLMGRKIPYIKSVNLKDVNKLSDEIISFILNKYDRYLKYIIINAKSSSENKRLMKTRNECIRNVPFVVRLILNIISNDYIQKLDSIYFINDHIPLMLKNIEITGKDKYKLYPSADEFYMLLGEYNVSLDNLLQIATNGNVLVDNYNNVLEDFGKKY